MFLSLCPPRLRSFRSLAGVLLISLFLLGCDSPDSEEDPVLDEQLREVLTTASDGAGLAFFRMPSSGEYGLLPQDPRNPITAEKVRLGQLLFHETGLAVNPLRPESAGTYSCGSCHVAASGFQSGLPQGMAEGGRGFGRFGEGRTMAPTYVREDVDVQPIRAPTVLNTAWQEAVLWNGQFGAGGVNAGTEAEWLEGTPLETNHLGYQGQEIQAIAGLEVHRMADGPTTIAATLSEYRDLFDAAFPDRPAEDRVTRETGGLAIATFVRTLLSNEAPFQRWLRGETEAMSQAQKRGALVFFGKAQCATCHTGPALNSMTFHALGMGELEGPGVFSDFNPKDPVHLGRASFTGRDEDRYQFKTPQLYNLADVRFLGHGSTFNTLRDVVEYKNAAVPQSALVPEDRLAPAFRPLQLTADEMDDLVTFLEEGLRDRNLSRYLPDAVLSGNCFPNNDAQSRVDLGCD